MREHKFRITYQHEETGRIATRVITLGEAIPSLGERWIVVGKDQHIGRRDKKGNEIYENDIVQSPDGLAGLVVWDYPVDAWRVKMRNWMLLTDNEAAVIGNIYANPDLLKSEEH